MDLYTFISIIITIAVLVGYINYRFIGMQTTIAIMTASLLISLVIIILQHLGVTNIGQHANALLRRVDFQDLLLKGILSFLLFAGALTIDITELKNQKWEIGVLATVSTIASTVIIGLATYYLFPLINIHVPLIYCLLFGALISPTDPIAVMATFKQLNVPKQLQTCVAGESLFNDGVGIVIFTSLYQLAFQHHAINFETVSMLFLKQAVGGLAYGFLLGMFTYWLVKPVDGNKIVILLTLGMVSGGYSLALWLGISGPLAMVVFGIYLGNKMRKHSTAKMNVSLQTFWEIIDEILNAVLFLLIGLEMVAIHAEGKDYLAMALAIPLVLLVRLITVSVPLKMMQKKQTRAPYTIAILTWGGLRGGLALALALSLPISGHLDLIISITYGIVAFSVIVQGLTIKPLARLTQ